VPTSTRSPIGDRTVATVGAEHVAHEEVTACEVELVLVDDDAEVQAVAHELALGLRCGLHDLLETGHRGPARELVDQVALRARDGEGHTDRSASL
jgi:hypothetical protein